MVSKSSRCLTVIVRIPVKYCTAWEKINHLLRMCVTTELISYASRNFNQYYTVICGLSGFTIFLTFSIKQHDFWKQCLELRNSVVIFSTNFAWNISHSKKNPERFFYKCTCLHVMYTLILLDINPLNMKLRLLYLKTQSVPRCKHFSSR